MVIRSFADWLNASWWQWGCWTGCSVQDWASGASSLVYKNGFKQWLNLPNVIDYKVVDIREGSLESFANYLDLPFKTERYINTSSSADLIRFLVNNRDALGRTVHSPSIELLLNEEISCKGNKPPYVVPSTIIQKSIGDFEDNIQPLLNQRSVISDKALSKYKSIESYKENRDDFSMQNFLSEPYDASFMEQISSLWAKKIFIPNNFEPSEYIYFNLDVKKKIDPYEHYRKFGIKEKP